MIISLFCWGTILTATAHAGPETTAGNRLNLILGTEVEETEHTGWEVRSSARLLWNASSSASMWAGASRAVPTPSPMDLDDRGHPFGRPGYDGAPGPAATGSPGADAGTLWAYEAGFQVRPLDPFRVDVALFYNDYDRLSHHEGRAPVMETTPPPLQRVLPLVRRNDLDGYTRGIEIACDWQPTNTWTFKGGYTYLKTDLDADASRDDLSRLAKKADGKGPRHQFSIQSQMMPHQKLEFDLWCRYVYKLPKIGVSDYLSLGARLGWHVTEHLDFSLVGQNLIEDDRIEFVTDDVLPTAAESGFYAEIMWAF
jgi:iron complex outermembrane receptor protein